MPYIYYLPDAREVETQEAESVLQAALRAGIPHAHACGGMALFHLPHHDFGRLEALQPAPRQRESAR